MSTLFELPEIFAQDSETFREETERFKSGALSAAEFRSFRVPLGVYEQREPDTYMLRVRFPGGEVLPLQMRTLARVARRRGNSVLHVTSRQDIQVHRVLLDDIHTAFAELFSAGLSTRGGGGNTVRNITGCRDAGVCAHELFDPTPFVAGLTEFLLPDPLSYQLPRKYKIAFAGCDRDCPGTLVNDLGFLARRRDDVLGFAVAVGGGMGASSRVADMLEDFVPADEVHLVAEAVKRVFDKHGNRKNRHKARLRFLMDRIGLDGFRELYEQEMTALRDTAPAKLRIRTLPPAEPSTPADEGLALEDFVQWRREVVTPQKQHPYFMVQIPLWLGDISADTMEQLADVVEQFGDGTLRTTQDQNLLIRWVHEKQLAGLHSELNRLGLAGREPGVLRSLISCTGASTCKLGICLSRGLATAVRRALHDTQADLRNADDVKIHISGCPNACGRHPIADIGLFGAVRRVGGHMVPHYVLQLGGRLGEGRTRLADGAHPVPARNVPSLVVDLLTSFCASSEAPDFAAFLDAEGRQLAENLVRKYRHVPDFDEDKNHYFDWGADSVFSLAGRGAGECGAGVFDLIEVDLASARDAIEQKRSLDATVLSARALLVTQGQEARNESEALELFSRHFIDANLVDGRFQATLERAQQAIPLPDGNKDSALDHADAALLVETVQKLYDEMDPSLRFRPVSCESAACQPVSSSADTAPAPSQIAREADLRGVVCPLNYVRTKMLLDQLAGGEVLSVLVDSQGAKNVPESVQKDGHEVLSTEQKGDQWRLLIRKA